MPDPNLQSYLAAHYLSGPKADAILARTTDGKVKRKKKRPKTEDASGSSSGLVFKDDSDSWKAAAGEDDEDGLTPQIVDEQGGSSSRAFRKIGSSSKSREAEDGVDQSAGEAAAADKAPEFRAGLRSKEEMKAARLAREQRRRREEASPSTAPTPNPAETEEDEEARLAQQTVYRDSSGHVIDIAAHEAQSRLLEQQAQREAAERSTWTHGLVQKQQRQSDAAALAAMQSQTVARRATDAEYNQHLKDQLREDDPALAFLTKKRTQGPQKPKYKGPWTPNRFGIPPGYRWDGVDRGNGFEKAFFERKSALARREQEARAWGQSDM